MTSLWRQTQDALTDFAEKPFRFTGRCGRLDFWLVTGALLGLTALLFVLAFALPGDGAGLAFRVLGALFVAGEFIPIIALMVRRLHDANWRGWWILLVLPAIFLPSWWKAVGPLALLALLMLPANNSNNRF